MDKIREKVTNFICYGGLEKEDFYSLRPVFDKMNLKVWRILSVFSAVIFGGLFWFTLGSEVTYPMILGINLAMLLTSGVIIFVLFYVVYEDGPFMNVVHYTLSIFMLILGMHLSMYVFTTSQSAMYFVLLFLFNVITADSSLRIAAIDIIMLLYFLILASEKKPDDVFTADVANAIIVTLMSIGANMVIMNMRCQSYFMLKHSSEKYRIDSASANAELKQSMKSIEVLSALSADFENIMYIDLNNNKILKFFSDSLVDKSDADLTKLSYGEYVNMFTERLVYEEDRAYVKEQFYPRGLLLSLAETKAVLVRYRVQINGEIKYYESKIIPDTSSNNKFMVIAATHDIDAETRRYMEYSTKLHETEVLATSDMLTGVKNKTAYFKTEREYNTAIEHGEKVKFAIIMCDVNNLKTTNDTLGHEAGDKLIKTACGKICSAFVHSPVFRIGGDEFVIVATGVDYDDRLVNFEKLRKMAAEATDGITFASGMSVYNPDNDFVFNDVFARADSEMYENKKSMKAKRGEKPRREIAGHEQQTVMRNVESPAEAAEKRPEPKVDEAAEEPETKPYEAAEKSPESKVDEAAEEPEKKWYEAAEKPEVKPDEAAEEPEKKWYEAAEKPEVKPDEAAEEPETKPYEAAEKSPESKVDEAAEEPETKPYEAAEESPEPKVDEAAEEPAGENAGSEEESAEEPDQEEKLQPAERTEPVEDIEDIFKNSIEALMTHASKNNSKEDN